MHVVNHFSQILLILNVQVDYYTLQVYSRTLITFVSLNDLNTPEKKHGVKHHFITPNQTVGITSILRMSNYNDREIFVPPPRKFKDWAFAKIHPEAKFPGRKVDRLKTYQVKDTPVFDMKSNVYVYTFGRTSFRETELCSKEEFDSWHVTPKTKRASGPAKKGLSGAKRSAPSPAQTAAPALTPPSAIQPANRKKQKTKPQTTKRVRRKTRHVVTVTSDESVVTSSDVSTSDESVTSSDVSSDSEAVTKEKHFFFKDVVRLNGRLAKLTADLESKKRELAALRAELKKYKKIDLQAKSFDRETKILLEKEKRKTTIFRHEQQRDLQQAALQQREHQQQAALQQREQQRLQQQAAAHSKKTAYARARTCAAPLSQRGHLSAGIFQYQSPPRQFQQQSLQFQQQSRQFQQSPQFGIPPSPENGQFQYGSMYRAYDPLAYEPQQLS